MKHLFYIVIICSFTTVFGQQIQVVPEKDSMQFGGKLNLEISAKIPMEIVDFTFPRIQLDSAIGKNFEVWKASEISKSSDQNLNGDFFEISQKIEVSCFEMGQVVFEPVPLVIKNDTIYSTPFLVLVDSVTIDPAKEAMDIADVISDDLTGWEKFQIWLTKNWWWLTIMAVVVFLVWFFFIRKRKVIEEPLPEVILPLHEKYLKTLSALVDKQYWNSNHHKQHYLELTDLVRGYFLERFNVNTFDKTSDDIINVVDTLNMPNDLKESTKQLFHKSQFVKFAKESPSHITVEQHNQVVKSLIVATKIQTNTKDE